MLIWVELDSDVYHLLGIATLIAGRYLGFSTNCYNLFNCIVNYIRLEGNDIASRQQYTFNEW